MKDIFETTIIVVTGILVVIFIWILFNIMAFTPIKDESKPYCIEYEYDSRGNMIREEDNKGKVMEREYDFKGLLIKEKHYIQK